MPSHKHADLMLRYAQDAQETDTPWDRWQMEIDGFWRDCSIKTKMFHPYTNFRRKPEVITINGIEVPEPMRVAPVVGTVFYIVDLSQPCMWHCGRWHDSPHQRYLLSIGICHLTVEALRKHAEALLSFTKVQE